MATFVLVPGGGHGGWCYQPVARLLRAAGHEVHALTLTGVGERAHLVSADVGLDVHIQDVVETLRFEDLTDVILVGHSYGGMVITGAADRAHDRVGRLVYLDAANPVDGQSLVDVAGPHMQMARDLGAVIDGVELVLLPGEGAAGFYGITDPDVAAWVDERLTAHPWRTFEQKLDLANEAELAAIPTYQIVCTETLATRDPDLMAKHHRLGRLWDIDTGHDLMLTEPEQVADGLQQIATSPR